MRRLTIGLLLAIILPILSVSWQNAPAISQDPDKSPSESLSQADDQHISAVWYAADAGERPHPIQPVEVVRGRPVLQIHYTNAGWSYPMDVVIELETTNTNWRRRMTWRITKNWDDWGDFVHVMLEPHPMCSEDIECRLTIRYGDDVVESRLVWETE